MRAMRAMRDQRALRDLHQRALRDYFVERLWRRVKRECMERECIESLSTTLH